MDDTSDDTSYYLKTTIINMAAEYKLSKKIV
jgi:hypothetical protein